MESRQSKTNNQNDERLLAIRLELADIDLRLRKAVIYLQLITLFQCVEIMLNRCPVLTTTLFSLPVLAVIAPTTNTTQPTTILLSTTKLGTKV